MIMKEKNILSDDSLGGLTSDKIKQFIRRKPHEYYK
jgi:hypothetical protein